MCLWQGISLSVAQYTALLKAVPAINAALREKGQAVGGSGDDTVEPPPKTKKDKTKPSKANFDATSDEDET